MWTVVACHRFCGAALATYRVACEVTLATKQVQQSRAVHKEKLTAAGFAVSFWADREPLS